MEQQQNSASPRTKEATARTKQLVLQGYEEVCQAFGVKRLTEMDLQGKGKNCIPAVTPSATAARKARDADDLRQHLKGSASKVALGNGRADPAAPNATVLLQDPLLKDERHPVAREAPGYILQYMVDGSAIAHNVNKGSQEAGTARHPREEAARLLGNQNHPGKSVRATQKGQQPAANLKKKPNWTAGQRHSKGENTARTRAGKNNGKAQNPPEVMEFIGKQQQNI